MKTRFWLLYVLPIFLILVFVAIMASGAFLKSPLATMIACLNLYKR